MNRQEMLLEVLPPLDWEKTGTETWGDVVNQVKKVGVKKFVSGMFSGDKQKRDENWQSVFEPVRQPEWWQGDAKYHAPAYEEPISELERRLREGEFVVTSEVAPPATVATKKLKENINLIKPYVTAINFTDSPSAAARMSSWACSTIAIGEGAEPVMQIAARDRTRVGLQGEVMGSNALGIRNILCLSGDSMVLAPPPRGRMDIVDLDAVQMLWLLRRIRDHGQYLDGRPIKFPPKYFLGAAASPFASEPKFQALREEKKVNAGAQFFQTNLVYDADGFEVWLNELAKRNILDKVYVLVGITPLKSYTMASYMHNDVPGVFIPEPLLKRMKDAGDNASEEGVQIALELIEKIRKLEGVSGLHLMPVMWESIVPRIVTEANLLPKGFVPPEPQPEKAAA
jgi:methylenetetrahydrofolate reductase (NADPH)